MTIYDKLKELGFSTVDASYYAKVQDWNSWYIGNVKNFHEYKIKTGKNTVNCKRYSLGMAKKVAEDWAGLLMNEKVKITLEGAAEQTFIDEIFTANNFTVIANEMQEIKFALGTVAYIPRVVGMVEGEGAKEIAIDVVTAPHIFPLSWHNGIIAECAFSSIVAVSGSTYLYLQIHRKAKDGTYDIENRIFRYENQNISDANLADVKGFENVPPVVHTRSEQRQFVIDRPNIANNLDYSVPMGVSVFANAIDALESCDIAFDAFTTDFITGKRRMFISPSATEYIGGEPAFDDHDIALYVLPEDITGENKPIQTVGGEFAVEHTRNGIQAALNLLSAKCGFGENHYSFEGDSVATATQVIAENSTLFRTIKKHEIILESALKELCRIILRLGNSAMNAGLNENVEISVDFDDSVIEDKTADFSRDMQLLSAGIMNDWEFRAKWMNEDEQTAKAALPKMQDLTTEPQGDVE